MKPKFSDEDLLNSCLVVGDDYFRMGKYKFI